MLVRSRFGQRNGEKRPAMGHNAKSLLLLGATEGAAGVTAGVQTPATLVVGAEKATHTGSPLSGSAPVGGVHVGCGRHPYLAAHIAPATRRTLLNRRAMQQHSPRQAVLRGNVRTHGGVLGYVPRPLVGSSPRRGFS